MLALGIRYLTGYSVSTDLSGRDQSEWPPHPARVFMAMAAAFFETGEDPDERDALEHLQVLGPPSMKVSEADRRVVVTHYVPVNDNRDPVKGGKQLTPLQSAPVGRDRQPRTYPRARPRDDIVYLVWPEAQVDSIKAALHRVCEKVIRIGHSSSLVQMWVEENPPEYDLEPSDVGEYRLRRVGSGTLSYLAATYNRDNIEAHADLNARIVSATGKEKKSLKDELTKRFPLGEPTSQRPTIGQWQSYTRHRRQSLREGIVGGAFEEQFIVLGIEDGPPIGLESTSQLMSALHKTILSKCHSIPEWMSGHAPDGSPSQQTHLALFPLAFVDSKHADGHIMGIGMAFPKGVPARDRGRALRGLLYDQEGRPNTIRLRAGRIGTWDLVREVEPISSRNLRVSTWTGPSQTWATVTPISLDRQPKADRAKDRERWSIEVAEIIAESCERQGLPRPVGIDVDKTSWFRGAPRAVSGNGSGFPLLPVKEGRPQRQQVHAWIHFDRRVVGPVLLGAGRYRGYGLCRPWKGGLR